MAATADTARYRELSTLGVGGMARVLLAEDTLLDRRVALKRLPTGADPQGVSRLRREALVGASISHPNVVSIYDVMAGENGEIVVVMEYVAGETLRQSLERRGRLPAAELLPIIDGVAAGLDAIHARGIVHRDVKPANILLGSDGSVKLADLGIASAPDRTQITTAGTVLGSFGYMAPEQVEDGPATAAIDVYALAAVAFEGLAGRKARPETNPVAAAHAIATGPPPDLREAWPAAPAAAAQVLARGMARDPAARPASAGALAAGLRRALQDRREGVVPGAMLSTESETESRTAPTRALPAVAAGRLRAVSWLVAPVLLAVVLLTVVLVLLGSGGPPRSHPAAAHPRVTSPPPTRAVSSPTVTAPAAPAPQPSLPPGHEKHHHHGKHKH